MFFKNKKISQDNNKYTILDIWPLKIKNFNLTNDYNFGEREHIEIFIVKEGLFMHDSILGKKSLRKGSVIISNPGNAHSITQVEKVSLIRIEFLHEWLAGDFSIILSSMDMFLLFFFHSWFKYPNKSSIYIFDIDIEKLNEITSDIATIEKNVKSGNNYDVLSRITFLKSLFLLSNEYKKYNRGLSQINLKDELIHVLKLIDITINSRRPLIIKELEESIDVSLDHFGKIFKKQTGLTLVDYAQKRRIHYCAFKLLLTDDNITKISEDLNFSDPAHLSNSFYKFYGITPSLYRSKYKTDFYE